MPMPLLCAAAPGVRRPDFVSFGSGRSREEGTARARDLMLGGGRAVLEQGVVTSECVCVCVCLGPSLYLNGMTHTHTLTLTHSHSHSHSLTLTLTLTLTHSHSHSHRAPGPGGGGDTPGRRRSLGPGRRVGIMIKRGARGICFLVQTREPLTLHCSLLGVHRSPQKRQCVCCS